MIIIEPPLLGVFYASSYHFFSLAICRYILYSIPHYPIYLNPKLGLARQFFNKNQHISKIYISSYYLYKFFKVKTSLIYWEINKFELNSQDLFYIQPNIQVYPKPA
jgi:hypothetical protein